MDSEDPPSVAKEPYELSERVGFKEVPQEPCVMLKGGIVVFFYVDDIAFCHRKGDEEKVQEVIKGLKMEYQMNILGELKWFLGIRVLRDRSQRLLWLSQEAYIEKIARQYEIDLNGRFPDIPVAECELLPTTSPRSIRPMLKSTNKALPKVADASTMLYQEKMSSMLYAATTTRPDIAFAVSRLAQFNQGPSPEHHQASDRVIQYFYGTRSRAICYGGDSDGTSGRRDDRGDNRGSSLLSVPAMRHSQTIPSTEKARKAT
jgi:Reverse transcriptase (RNA-dependent DNA polymerase)